MHGAIHDTATDSVTIVELSTEEIVEIEATRVANEEKRAIQEAAEIEKRADKERIAQALGLTLDDLKILLS